MSSTVFVNSVTLTAASWFQDVDNVAYQYLSGVAGTNTITATGPAGLGAYAAGLKFRFIPAATNTGATTINITGTAALGARSIFSGGAALTGGELVSGIPIEIIDDGTQFQVLSQSRPTFTSAETAIPGGGAGSTTTIAHGLATVPRQYTVVMRNKTTELGYAVGDEVLLPTGAAITTTTYADATNVGIVLLTGFVAPTVVRRDTFAAAVVAPGNWKYVARAWR